MKGLFSFVTLFNLFCHQNPITATESCVILPLLLIQQTEQVKQPTTDGGFIFSSMKDRERKEITFCEICGHHFKLLSGHLKSHKISPEEYYLKYVNPDRPVCKIEDCNNYTKFAQMSIGFNIFCSRKCRDKNIQITQTQEPLLSILRERAKRIGLGTNLKGKTLEESLGEEKGKKKRQAMRDYAKTEKFQSMMKSEWYSKKLSDALKNKPKSEEFKRKAKIRWEGKNKGEENGNWKGGVSQVTNLICGCSESTAWKVSFFRKCNTCFICSSDNNCQVHHLESLSYLIRKYKLTKENWRSHFDILFDPKNGIVLCEDHHAGRSGYSFHSIMGQYHTRKKHFELYLMKLNLLDKLKEFKTKYNTNSKT